MVEVEPMRDDLEKLINSIGMGGRSIQLGDIAKKVQKFAAFNSAVLILGESGTGKDVLANAIHHLSNRRTGPFIAVNCAGIKDTLFESELFGHMKGSFTGAIADKKGFFQAAHKGTIFLDEIGDMPFDLQAKMLRVLQEKDVTPVGANKPEKVNVRIIAATNANLEAKIAQGKFREDLFYRLNGLSVQIPPLRERKSDIEPLVAAFCEGVTREKGITKKFLARTVRQLETYDWPGNVRELKSEVEKLMVLTESSVIEPLVGATGFEPATI